MKVQVNIRMEEDLKARLEELARKDGRSLNNLINKVLCDFVAKGIVERYRKEKDKPQERTWFGNDVAYDFPDCENYKDGICEIFNCACKDEVACNTKFKKRWEKEK